MTLQKYDIPLAVYEFFENFFQISFEVRIRNVVNDSSKMSTDSVKRLTTLSGKVQKTVNLNQEKTVVLVILVISQNQKRIVKTGTIYK